MICLFFLGCLKTWWTASEHRRRPRRHRRPFTATAPTMKRAALASRRRFTCATLARATASASAARPSCADWTWTWRKELCKKEIPLIRKTRFLFYFSNADKSQAQRPLASLSSARLSHPLWISSDDDLVSLSDDDEFLASRLTIWWLGQLGTL